MDDLLFPNKEDISEGSVSKESLIRKIRDSLTTIIESKFSQEPEKQKIREYHNRINFSCPACGDSKRDASKKRGNIFLNSLNFNCFNAESAFCANTHTVLTFLKEFGELDKYDPVEVHKLKQLISEGRSLQGTVGGKSFQARSLLFPEAAKKAIPREEIMKRRKVIAPFGEMPIDLVEIKDNLQIRRYLKERGQLNEQDLNHFAYDKRNKHLYMFNMTPDKKGVIGIQIRKQKVKNTKSLRFLSYAYSDIWEKMFGEEIKEEIKEEMNWLSMIYNVLCVNYAMDVHIFEGIMDSHHIPNSLATLSASSKIYLDNGLYIYDRDETGIRAAVQMLEEGYSTFLWNKFMNDHPEFKDCKDMNDIFCMRPIKIETLHNYFSNDPLDVINL